jgi:outer membrane protein
MNIPRFTLIPSRTLIACLAAGCFSLCALAQTKVAVINLKAVFDGYWKTKQADIQLKDRQGDFEKARKGLIDDYQKANEDYRKLVESSNDRAVSAEEREKRKKDADGKLLDIREIEQNIQAFDRNMTQTLRDQQKRMRDNILKDIRQVIDAKSKSNGYTLVIDTAAETVNLTPFVLYNTGSPDLTEDVLSQINSTAPAGALTSPDKAADEKDKDKSDDKK